MIDSIRGRLVSVGGGQLIVDVGGLSLNLQAPGGVCDAMNRLLLNTGDAPEVRLFTHLLVRPESWQLFGFRDTAQREIFRALLGIPGIGPRLAMSLLSHLSWQEIQAAVAAHDQARFQAVPGIGKRTAARIVVELSGKIEGGGDARAPAPGSPAADALDALVALGVGRAEAANLVRSAAAQDDSGKDTAALVAAALKHRR